MSISMSVSSVMPGSHRSSLILKLQQASNGFDIRGITVTAGTEGTHIPALSLSPLAVPLAQQPLLTNELAFWIGVGFAEHIKQLSLLSSTGKHKNKDTWRVGIGRDSRHTGVALTAWFAGGLAACGVEGVDTGICSTPSMFLSCDEPRLSTLPPIQGNGDDHACGDPWPFDGAVSITASHLPSEWNGFKFFAPNFPTNIGADGIQAIISNVQNLAFDDLIPQPAEPRFRPFVKTYSRFLQQTIIQMTNLANDSQRDRPLQGIKICVNAGNGCGGFLAETLSELGADTSSSIHLDPDGCFPNHPANPEDAVAISATARQVQRCGADLGICLDADADRVGLVDGHCGEILNRNKLIALVASIAMRGLRRRNSNSAPMQPTATIVTDSATSNGLSRYLTSMLSLKHLRFKKGYRYVIEKARSIDDAVVAVECSGHGAWEQGGWVDDGCYTAIRVLAEYCNLRRSRQSSDDSKARSILSQLIDGYSDPAESHEFRLNVRTNSDMFKNNGMHAITEAALSVLRVLAENLEGWTLEPVNYEGLRANFMNGDGWVMIRASLHEPIVSMHIESELKGGIRYAVGKLLEEPHGLKSIDQLLDVSSLMTYLAA